MSARGSASPQEPPVTLSLPRLGRLGALLAGEDKGAGDRAAVWEDAKALQMDEVALVERRDCTKRP